MTSELILKEIIEGYRRMLHDRYEYQNIIERFEVPEMINEAIVTEIRDYFLNYIYPEYATRQELNEAFESLDSYIKRPEKLVRMLMNSITLLFSHGRHLPRLLKTGLKALKSFRTASKFEASLADKAIENNIDPPFDAEKIGSLLTYLPSEDINAFIENSSSLVQVLSDQKLIEEVQEILEFLIRRMKKKKRLYSETEIKGLELGLQMLQKGEKLFNQFTEEEQTMLIDLIIETERNFLQD